MHCTVHGASVGHGGTVHACCWWCWLACCQAQPAAWDDATLVLGRPLPDLPIHLPARWACTLPAAQNLCRTIASCTLCTLTFRSWLNTWWLLTVRP